MFFKYFSKKRRIYLDFASRAVFGSSIGNPNALHQEGVHEAARLLSAREKIAKTIKVQPSEVVCTSGATEANNIALQGAVYGLLAKGYKPEEIEIITSDIEHASVSAVAQGLADRVGIVYTQIQHTDGYVNPKDIIPSTHIRACIVSIIFVQNEIGSVQPIKEIAKRIRHVRKEFPQAVFVLHTDATQAPLYIDLSVPSLGIDMMTLGSAKLACQNGVGFVYIKKGIPMAPVYFGGGQEFGLRSGTQPVALIEQFAHAVVTAQKMRASFAPHIQTLRDYFETRILETFPFIQISSIDGERSPHISHLLIPHIDSELLVIELDARGIAVSSQSACSNDTEKHLPENLQPKNVATLRVSFGSTTKKRDIDRLIKSISQVLTKYNKSL